MPFWKRRFPGPGANLLLLLSTTLFLLAYNRPSFYQNHIEPTSASLRLDHLILEVNGQKRTLKNGETSTFVRGDQLRIVAANLETGTATVQEVNLVGFHADSKNTSRNDLGLLVDTAKRLDGGSWAVDAKREVYAIVAASTPFLHGIVYLRRVDPLLQYIELKVNGISRVVRAGERLQLKSSDLFKVEKVVTNLAGLEESEEQLSFKSRVLESSDGSERDPAKSYELQFFYRSVAFGKITLLLEDKLSF